MASRRLAAERGVSMTTLVRQAVAPYLGTAGSQESGRSLAAEAKPVYEHAGGGTVAGRTEAGEVTVGTLLARLAVAPRPDDRVADDVDAARRAQPALPAEDPWAS